MIKSSIKAPLFGDTIEVLFGSKTEVSDYINKKYGGDNKPSDDHRATTWQMTEFATGERHIAVSFCPHPDLEEMVHESIHVANFLFSKYDIAYNRERDEVLCYFAGRLFVQIYKEYRKCLKRKPRK